MSKKDNFDEYLLDGKVFDPEGLTKSDWGVISRKPLSESFIRKYQNNVIWNIIEKYQTHLSEEFKEEFKEKFEFNLFSSNGLAMLHLISKY